MSIQQLQLPPARVNRRSANISRLLLASRSHQTGRTRYQSFGLCAVASHLRLMPPSSSSQLQCGVCHTMLCVVPTGQTHMAPCCSKPQTNSSFGCKARYDWWKMDPLQLFGASRDPRYYACHSGSLDWRDSRVHFAHLQARLTARHSWRLPCDSSSLPADGRTL